MTREEAIHVVKSNWPDSRYSLLQEALKTLIPEFKEDGDERIWKMLLSFVKNSGSWLIPENKELALTWLEKQNPLVIKEALKAEYEKGRADAIAEMQKLAWCEEDERIYSRIYDLIHAAAYANYDVDEDGKELGEYVKMTNLLKSLKPIQN